MSSSVHVDNKGKNISILGEGPTQWLNHKLTTEAKYPINFIQSRKRFALSLHDNRSNSFLFVNAMRIYQFKVKNFEIKDYALCLGNVSKDFKFNNMIKIGLKGVVKFFYVDFNPIDNNKILDIHKYLMKKTWFKIMFGLIKKTFMGLLISIVKASNDTKCVSSSNQKCNIQPTLINLHPSECDQELHYYPFSVKLDSKLDSKWFI